MLKEIKALTGLRGIAALYVAIYHWFRSNEDQIAHLPLYSAAFIKHGYISVDLFFILSGFVITLSSVKLFDKGITLSHYTLFIKRRFIRIYPIYLVITLIAFVLLFKLHNIRALFLNLMLVQVITSAQYVLGPSWSLSAEWFAYILFPVILYFTYFYKNTFWPFTCILFSFAVLVLVSITFSKSLNGLQTLNGTYGPLDRYRGPAAVLRCFAEYLVGISLFRIFTSYKNLSLSFFNVTSVLSVLFIVFLLFVSNSDILLVLLSALLIFSLSADQGIIAKALGSKYLYLLGQSSYSLYLIHPIIIKSQAAIYNQLNKFHVPYSAILSYTMFGTSLIVCSYLTHRYIELPLRDYTKRKLIV